MTSITELLVSYQDTINLTSCDINQVGTVVDRLFNSRLRFGSDIHYKNY
ncbi:MAG: hypothetical protein R2753_04235 [Chitinophagales bacterium]